VGKAHCLPSAGTNMTPAQSERAIYDAHFLMTKITEFGNPLPIWLRKYGSRRQVSSTNWVRNAVISVTIHHITQRHLRRTNNLSESGCSIVKKALERMGIHMTERKLAAIWQETQTELIESAIQYAVLGLSEWMPFCDRSVEKSALFDVARMLVCDDSSLRDSEIVEAQTMLHKWYITEALYGSRPAHEALCYAATGLIQRDDPLPSWLARYFVYVATQGRAPSKRGPPKANSVRDVAITWVINAITKSYHLCPIRGAAMRDKATTESGCSIVREALKRLNIQMTEENVNGIWRRMGSSADKMYAAAPSVLKLEMRWSRLACGAVWAPAVMKCTLPHNPFYR
jgi:hypothetical protein